MSVIAPIEVVLDLRDFSERLRGGGDFRALWNDLLPALVGRTLTAGDVSRLEDPRRGTIRLNVIVVPDATSVIDKETPFAVHAVLEPPLVYHQCSVCRGYAPFRCSACEGDKKKRMCDLHAIILDGSMRAFCPEHAPRCYGSGGPATFWCDGQRCRGRVAWSEPYRVRHPNDPDHWYCPDCFKELFPPCEHSGCDATGTVICEYVDQGSGQRCDRRVCNRHAWRWQIYGPHRRGLGLCPAHSNLRRLTDEQIVFQVAAGTAVRNKTDAQGRNYREYFPLPTLQSIRHIFLHTRKAVYDVRQINGALDDVARKLGQNSLDRAIATLIEKSRARRQRDIDRDDSEKNAGLQQFRRLQQALTVRGSDDLAQAVRFADFRPRSNVLFIHLDEAWRGLFIGRGGNSIRELERSLGFRIDFDKGSSGK